MKKVRSTTHSSRRKKIEHTPEIDPVGKSNYDSKSSEIETTTTDTKPLTLSRNHYHSRLTTLKHREKKNEDYADLKQILLHTLLLAELNEQNKTIQDQEEEQTTTTEKTTTEKTTTENIKPVLKLHYFPQQNFENITELELVLLKSPALLHELNKDLMKDIKTDTPVEKKEKSEEKKLPVKEEEEDSDMKSSLLNLFPEETDQLIFNRSGCLAMTSRCIHLGQARIRRFRERNRENWSYFPSDLVKMVEVNLHNASVPDFPYNIEVEISRDDKNINKVIDKCIKKVNEYFDKTTGLCSYKIKKND